MTVTTDTVLGFRTKHPVKPAPDAVRVCRIACRKALTLLEGGELTEAADLLIPLAEIPVDHTCRERLGNVLLTVGAHLTWRNHASARRTLKTALPFLSGAERFVCLTLLRATACKKRRPSWIGTAVA